MSRDPTVLLIVVDRQQHIPSSSTLVLRAKRTPFDDGSQNGAYGN
jgi:hypothetical protein